MLIEEAAGLGKHRKRRRRAQLKLERTQDNLDRALDVEREARTRLKPLKRQAEAAELHERIERQIDEARWTLARDGARVRPRGADRAPRPPSPRPAPPPRPTEAELAAVGKRREAAEEALSSRGSERESAVVALLLGPFDRRADRHAPGRRAARGRRAGRAHRPPARRDRAPGGRSRGRHRRRRRRRAHRRAADRARRARRGLPRPARAGAHRARGAPRGRHRAARRAHRGPPAPPPRAAAGEAAAEAARRARRELDTAAEKARRESARVGAELAKVNQFLRANAGAPGGATALADILSAAPGYELALTAALGPRLRAAVAPRPRRRAPRCCPRRARTEPPR